MRDWMVERLIAAQDKGKKETRATCKAALEEVNRTDNNFPIFLEKLTFNVFSHYMSTKKGKKSEGYLSTTIYGVVRSSLPHLYFMSGKTMDRGFKKELSQFMSGMKRVVAANKRESGASLNEGKRATSFEVNNFFCEELYNRKGYDHFLACFLDNGMQFNFEN